MVETEELPGTVLVEAQSPTSKTEGNASMETLSCFVKGFGRYHPKPQRGAVRIPFKGSWSCKGSIETIGLL